jgi:hypothetical protein
MEGPDGYLDWSSVLDDGAVDSTFGNLDQDWFVAALTDVAADLNLPLGEVRTNV